MAEDLGKSSLNMDPKVEALLAYVLGLLTGIIFYIIEKDNRFVRFHAFQCILVYGGLFVIYIVLAILQAVLVVAFHSGLLAGLFMLVWGIVGLLGFVLWILLMVKAYQGVWFKLPVVGDMAEKRAKA